MTESVSATCKAWLRAYGRYGSYIHDNIYARPGMHPHYMIGFAINMAITAVVFALAFPLGVVWALLRAALRKRRAT